MPRKRIYADDNARLAAYREKHAQIGVMLDPEKKRKLEEIAKLHDVSVSTVARAMITHSLTTHNWSAEMLWKSAK